MVRYISSRTVYSIIMSCSVLFVSFTALAENHTQECDYSFTLPGVYGTVYHIHSSGSMIYAAGEFYSAGGVMTRCFAVWDGARWRALGTGIGEWEDEDYNVHPSKGYKIFYTGSDLYVSGIFHKSSDTFRYKIKKLVNGSFDFFDITFPEGFSPVDILWAGNGILYISSEEGDIGLWDGTDLTKYDNPYNMNISCITVTGSTIYIAGKIGSDSRIVKYDGSDWTLIDGVINGDVNAVACDGSIIYVGGSFSSAGGTAASNIARWDGTWSALGSGVNGSVKALVVENSILYAGGNFTASGGTELNYIGMWDGTQWSEMDSGTDAQVRTITSLNGQIYAGGDFLTAGSAPAMHAARWDGTQWHSMGSGTGLSGPGYALLYKDGIVYAGGSFKTAGAVIANSIAAWNGESWSALGDGIEGTVYSMLWSDGYLYAGGDFSRAGSVSADNIARWDGTNWQALGSGIGNPAEQILAGNNKIYALANNWIQEWDGTSWQPLTNTFDGDHRVDRMVMSDTALIAFGSFYKDNTYYGIASYNFNFSSWNIIPSSFFGTVTDVILKDGKFYSTNKYRGLTTDPSPILFFWDTNWNTVPGQFKGFPTYHDGAIITEPPEAECLCSDNNAVYIGGNFYNVANSELQDLIAFAGTDYKPVVSVALDKGLDKSSSFMDYGYVYDVIEQGDLIYFTGSFSHTSGIPSYNFGIAAKPDFNQQGSSFLSQSIMQDSDNSSSMGCSWTDYNMDGYPDLFFANDNNEYNYLYAGNGDGTFTQITTGPVISEEVSSYSGSWADIDNDGDPDLFVANYGTANSLFINNGDGTFTAVPGSPVTSSAAHSSCGAWADYDNDGWIDLVVTNIGEANELFHNNGDGTFSVNTSETITTGTGSSTCASWCDIDRDGDPDLLVCNKTGENNRLFINNGSGSFTERTTGPIVTDGSNSTGGSWADMDNDGDFDLFVVNNGETDAVYENDGDGNFTKRTDLGDLTSGTDAGKSGSWADADGDGDMDVFVSNRNEPSVLFINNNGSFTAQNQATSNARGASWCDLDNNGTPDLAVACDGSYNLLYSNNAEIQNWLNFNLQCTTSNKSGIGTIISVQTGTVWQTRFLTSCTGFGSQNGSQLLFGLGSADHADSVRVLFPSGEVYAMSVTSSNQTITVQEPSGSEIVQEEGPANFLLSQNYPNPFNPETTIRFVLPAAQHVVIKIYTIRGREISTLIDKQMSAGHHRIIFKTNNLPTGIYLYQINTKGFTRTRRMVLMK